MLEAFVKTDSPTFEAAFGNLKDIFNDSKFNKTVDDYQKDLENEVKELGENAVKEVLTPDRVKNFDDLTLITTTAIEARKVAFNKFMENIKTYTVLYCKTLKG
jgi:hypothetical protein